MTSKHNKNLEKKEQLSEKERGQAHRKKKGGISFLIIEGKKHKGQLNLERATH